MRAGMTRCWLHIGMPKTGSTSIQQTLDYELRDPGFTYCGFGEINGSLALSSFVGQETHIAAMRGLNGGRRQRLYSQRMMGRFHHCLSRARANGAELILSSELTYGWSVDQHLWWHQFARDQGLELRIVLYLRPPLDWLGSSLSEGLKYARQVSHDALMAYGLQVRSRGLLLYANRLETLGKIYGQHALKVRPFLRNELLEGCVVRDFCRVVGIRKPPIRIHRQNDSLSLEACRCLHLHNVARRRPPQGSFELLRRDVLLQQLEEIFHDQPSLRLHPSVLGEQIREVSQQLALIQERHGITLPLSVEPTDEGLTSLDSLLSLPDWARDRLMEAVGSGFNMSVEELLEQLERNLPLVPLLRYARQSVRRRLRHIQVGC